MSSQQTPEAAPPADEGLPWYVKTALLVTLVVIAFVVVVDVLAVAGAF